MSQLPKSLDREPLIDAVFEVRLGGNPHIADLLPGALFAKIDPKPTLRRLPAAEIPQPIRSSDPNLSFTPVVRLELPEVTISFGDRNLVIGCKLPYPKWPRFKEKILEITKLVSDFGVVGSVDRYSLKYVNLIQAATISDQIAKIDLTVRVGQVQVKDDHLSIQVHRKEDDILHIISVVTGAQGNLLDGKQIFGAVVDVDSIRVSHFSDFSEFAATLESSVESLRIANKTKFFSCLTKATIEDMGPTYD